MARVRIGIIGTGWGARVQVPAFRQAGLTVTAIAGRDPAKTQRVAEELDLHAFLDWKDLVASPEFGLVSIVTPPSEHLEMALAALEAGKHVLSEKPTAMNAQEAEWMSTAAARRRGQLALIDHELRFLPAWRTARESREELGEVRYAEIRYASPSRRDPSRPWNWWSDAQRGGGIWGAIGSHFVDALRYFIGEIEAVHAVLHTFIPARPFDGGTRKVTSDDFAAVHLRLERGALAAMIMSVVAGHDEPTTITVHGEKAAFRLVGEDLLWSEGGREWQRRVAGEHLEVPGNSGGGAFGTGTVYFGRALRATLEDRDRQALAPAATFLDGLAQQRVLDAARRSHGAGGRWEPVR
jgi:predicted dehydrogenase